jgi:hypothetical protein
LVRDLLLLHRVVYIAVEDSLLFFFLKKKVFLAKLRYLAVAHVLKTQVRGVLFYNVRYKLIAPRCILARLKKLDSATHSKAAKVVL